ncbi:MmcQ/YjbR family DNA-binding protein [Amaricoccus sp.]|uniref:MmcQ/YjbR family DNA-binding protein n=1 Tax=Amaricoccus sp. TaxID=1872485 RepID=UPI001B483968|nr:MmcQ/YjbR family DNA-binding protein [Amaricoccus sp.]MBP7242761.1 MmcQ/YjbR family DNA-binding protein [Amaricoccus sp.]
MTRAFVNAHCARLPGAEVSDPWGGGHDAWKVGGKLFALVGSMELGVSVKTADPETAALLIELGQAERAPYLHASWVRVPWGLASDEDLARRLDISYDLIRARLPKRTQAALPPRSAAAGSEAEG